jgi:UDP-N-acetylglucosamine 2-epimerase (non-hydrolysing)
VLLREPLSYRENLGVMESAAVVLTDSGGIQEESTFLGVPCLTLRANTERPVTVSHGTNTLVGDDLSQVPSLVEMVLAGRYKRAQGIDGWDGRAAERVAEVLLTTWAVR